MIALTFLTVQQPIKTRILKESVIKGPFRYNLGAQFGTYEGGGVRSGKGIFIFYEGTWQDDNMWDYGRLITQNSYYEGEIVNGVAHGQGTFQNSIKVYSREWKNDQRHGVGEKIYKNKRYRYKGQFANDKYQGQGVLQDEDSTYSGHFTDGLFDGEGIIRYKSGETFAGIFKNGERVAGRQQMPDGSFYDGQYEGDDTFVGYHQHFLFFLEKVDRFNSSFLHPTFQKLHKVQYFGI